MEIPSEIINKSYGQRKFSDSNICGNYSSKGNSKRCCVNTNKNCEPIIESKSSLLCHQLVDQGRGKNKEKLQSIKTIKVLMDWSKDSAFIDSCNFVVYNMNRMNLINGHRRKTLKMA